MLVPLRSRQLPLAEAPGIGLAHDSCNVRTIFALSASILDALVGPHGAKLLVVSFSIKSRICKLTILPRRACSLLRSTPTQLIGSEVRRWTYVFKVLCVEVDDVTG